LNISELIRIGPDTTYSLQYKWIILRPIKWDIFQNR
jgi:hypothetical protein